jgi:hypothetical protein
MIVKFFDSYGFYSDLFKYLLKKYYNPVIEPKKVKGYSDELTLDLYTIVNNSTVSGMDYFGYQESTGDWYYDGHWAYYISWIGLKDLCIEFSKNIGYER